MRNHILNLSLGLLVLLIAERQAPAQYNDNAGAFYPGQVIINSQPANMAPGGGPSLSSLANSLVMESQQALDNLRYEMAGTDVCLQGEFRGIALLNACKFFQNNLQTTDARVLQLGFTNIDRAFTAFSQLMSPYGQDASRTVNSLDRIQRLTFQARNRIGSYQPGSPGLPVNAPPAFNPRAMADATARLQIAIDQLSRTLARYYQEEYGPARNSASQMEGLNRFLQGLLTSSVRNDEIWQATQQLRLTSWDLFAFAAQYPIDQALRNQIVSTKQLHDVVCNLAGSDPNGPIFEPGMPPGKGRIVKQAPPNPAIGPGQPGIPPMVRPTPPSPPQFFQPTPEFLALLNNTLNQSDTLLKTIELHVNQLSYGYRLQASLRMLRSDLLALNQQVRQSSNRRELQRFSSGLIEKTNELAGIVQQYSGGKSGPLIDQLRTLDQSIRQVVQLLR
jgi:hypothetical protein